MFLKTFPVGMLQCNCVILGDPKSGEALVVDPGGDADVILEELVAAKLRLAGILHTHAHIDHVGATAELARVTGAPTYLHAADRFLFDFLPEQAKLVGLAPVAAGRIDQTLEDEQTIRVGGYELGVLHTPGHSPGSVSFVLVGEELCLSGDTLFAGGIGRTDLWGGSMEAIERSIRDRIYTLEGSVRVIPGHGPETTIDYERSSNPFVRG